MTATAELTDVSERIDSAPAQAPAQERPPAFRLPHGLTSTRFGLLIGAILVAGLVALLAVNTSLAAGAIELGGLQSTLARTTEQQQALDLEVEDLSSTQSLQAKAISLGMVPAAAPAFLNTATGKLSGALVPAQAGTAPKTGAPMVTVPDPKPTPTPSASSGATSSGVEPPATLVMPPDPGADGATVTRPAPVRSGGALPDTSDASGASTAQGATVPRDGSDDAAELVGGRR